MIGGCLRRVFVLAIVVVGAVLAWQYREPLRAAWVAFRSAQPAGPDRGTDLAQGAVAKMLALESGRVDRVAEVQEDFHLPAAELEAVDLFETERRLVELAERHHVLRAQARRVQRNAGARRASGQCGAYAGQKSEDPHRSSPLGEAAIIARTRRAVIAAYWNDPNRIYCFRLAWSTAGRGR